MKNLTPIRRQYLKIKARHLDAILLFRLGDFYEAFDEDARILAKELDIALTSKPMGKNIRVPLAGIPHFVLEKHLATLISKGHRVAICEQTSNQPVAGADGKKLIKREVVRVVTAGTVIEPELLESKSNNYLVSFCSDGKKTGIAFADISTGDFGCTQVENKDALTELQRLAPAEILISETVEEVFSNQDLPKFVTRINSKFFEHKNAKKSVLKHFEAKTLNAFGLAEDSLAVPAVGALLSYLNQTQSTGSGQLTRLKIYDSGNFMALNNKTLKSLEIFQSSSELNLFSVIDQTKTAMGGRLLRRWLRRPLLDVAEIFSRQEIVGWLKEHPVERKNLRRILEDIRDIERLSGRAKANYIAPFELRAFGKSLELIPRIKEILRTDPVKFGKILTQMPECLEVSQLIKTAISEEFPSQNAGADGFIREGYSSELDKLRQTLVESTNFLANLEKREKKRTGIKSLRVGFNKVFGYYIEVTKPNLHLVPGDYTRKQTLVPAERFITLELKEQESLIIHTRERINELENNLFRQICFEVGQKRTEILRAASTIAFLDALAALGKIADKYVFCRPTVNETSLLRIKKGRHPVLERQGFEQRFVPNDAALGGNGAPQIALITGPNASGKSTYLRQVALIVILAQIGSFVPAEEAVIGICDRIFTRIGLYDRIGSGESTFMTEMIETAEILHNATGQSLILLDELGRGTSTYDGLAVARSVLEYLHNHPKLRTRTLFATHYHELAELADLLPNLSNYRFLIEEDEGKLEFKYKIEPGTALKSYGVYAARIAGLPKPVIRRAGELLEKYQQNDAFDYQTHKDGSHPVEEFFNKTDLDNLSPVEALMKLFELKKLLENKPPKNNLREIKKAVG